jgi:hypothetical protein
MNWNCEYCKKSVSFWEKNHFNKCNACITEEQLKKEAQRREERQDQVKKFVSIFKEDNEKFYKTIAVLAMLNGIEYDDENNDAIIIRTSGLR